jgi:hypothetical protein
MSKAETNPNRETLITTGSLHTQGTYTKRGRLSTTDFLIRAVNFVKKKEIMFSIQKAADLNLLAQGGQLYRAFFPFGKGFPALLYLQVLQQKENACHGHTPA